MKITREEAYSVLELPADSDDADVKKSFKRLALRLHPDKNAGCEQSAEKFKMVSAAYARLTSDHQSDDELDDGDFEGAFPEEMFEQMFGDSGMQFAFIMQEMLSGLQGGMHSRMHKGPRVRLHRPGMPARTRGVPMRPSAPFGSRPGIPPGFMRGMFQPDFHAHDDSSSEWETDDEAGESQAGAGAGAGPSEDHRTKAWSSAESTSEWETDDGSENGEEGPSEQGKEEGQKLEGSQGQQQGAGTASAPGQGGSGDAGQGSTAPAGTQPTAEASCAGKPC